MKYALILSLLLAGCGTTQPIERTTTVEVKVPVPTPIPAPPDSVRPELMIYQLTDADNKNPGKVVQYYKASIKQLQGYAEQLETVIDGYRKASQATPGVPTK